MIPTGIARIDALWTSDTAAPIHRGDTDAEAVGAIQDLLNGHRAGLPGALGGGHGQFGAQTETAIVDFQNKHGLAPSGVISRNMLHTLVDAPAASPVTSRAYLALALDLPWTGFTRLVALTAQFEGGGKFSARNRNTDRAGLSFGIIQWAQKPRRLNDILRAFQRAQPDRFVQVFGGGDGALAAGLIAHSAKPTGGVDWLGKTTDQKFDLVNDEWMSRFGEAARDRVWQKTQIDLAVSAFRASSAVIRSTAPVARSERALAFLLDVANQHGDGGMQSICARCATPDIAEPAFLQAAQDESVRRLGVQFGDGSSEMQSTFERRQAFRTSPMLSDEPFRDE
jgi:peptidoglycan hydrolase-like protein with peptidoglycan-binding domain